MKNVITWAFSTWKSTVVNNLSLLVDIPFSLHMERKYMDLDSYEWIKNMQYNMLRDELKELKQNWLSDNSFYTQLAYCKFSLSKEDYEFIYKIVKSILTVEPYDNVFYIPPELEIENDWLRHTDVEFQKAIDNEIRNLLSEFEQPYTIVKWSIQERVYIIINKLWLETE
jgi:nicotinamide riboside kinase